MRILALDVGEKRIGVAVSDPLGITAQGLDTVEAAGWSRDKAKIGEIARAWGTDRVVVGLPLTLSGQVGPQAEKVMRFAEQLISCGLKVKYFDERLTTSFAQRALREGGVRGDKRKQHVDRMAAQGILQGFLDAGGWPEAVAYRMKGERMDNQDMERGQYR